MALLAGGLVWAHLIAPQKQSVAAPYTGVLVVRIYYEDVRELQQLQSYDLWEYNSLDERYVLAALDDAGYRALLSEGFRVEIDEEASAAMTRREKRFSDFYGDYRTVDELYADLKALNRAFPQLTELVDYGESYCLSQGGCTTPGGDEMPGHPLRAMRVTNEAIGGSSIVADGVIARGSKPIFFLMANIHAREITTPEIAMRLLDVLTVGYGVDADLTWLVDYHEIWVIPTANPDGHRIVELGEEPAYGGYPFFQRKNANNAAGCPVWPPSSSEQFGVDLNRYHSFDWGLIGASDQPCSPIYRGSASASENEVARLETLIRALIPDQRGPSLSDAAGKDTTGLFITLHSFGDQILWPWGQLYSPAPNQVDLQAIGDKLASFNGYSACQAASCLYATSGASDDWAYGELGIPAFTFEIGEEFMPAYSEIDNRQWIENGPALIYGAKIARTPYQTIYGPETMNVAVSGEEPTLTISATVDDSANGNRPIAAAQYALDAPPWVEGATLYNLSVLDGVFDSSVETVVGSIEMDGLAAGRHTIFVRGRDDKGNWGTVSAAFFDFNVERAFMPILAGQ
jgi:hypothetical protein